MSIFDHALHIPAERPFFEPQRAQHERVLLPLRAGLSLRFYGAVALAIFAAAACLCMGTEMALSCEPGGGGLVFAVGFLAAALMPAGIAAVGIHDGMQGMPCLVIDADGLCDSRLGGERIAWHDVASAEIVASSSGINAVRLLLRAEVPARFNPYRIGGWSVEWRTRRHSRTIALMLLDVRAHALAHTILALAARHGATVASPWSTQAWPPA